MNGSRDGTERDGLKPWWRSVGFWVGLWGMAFLVWVWNDSFSHGSHAGVARSATYSSAGATVPFAPWLALVSDGSVIYQKARVTGDSMKVAMSPQWPVANWRRGMSSGKALKGMWGSYSEKIAASPTVAFEVMGWWCSFGFVVGGYVVVWIGSLVMWRWWMRRRVKAAEVVEG